MFKKVPFERKVVGLLIVVLLFVSTSAILVYVNLHSIINEITEEARPDESLIVMKGILYDITEAENDVKSYSLTRESEYLQAFNEKTVEVDQKLEQLRDLSKNDTEQLTSIDSLDKLTKYKFSILEDLLILQNKFKIKDVFDEVMANIEDVEEKGNQNKNNTQSEDINGGDEPEEDDDEEVKKSFFKRLFGKRKDKEKDESTSEDLSQLDDTVAEENNNNAINQIGKEVSALRSQQLQEESELRKEELKLIQEDKIIMDKIMSIVHDMEIKEVAAMENQIAKAEQKSGQTKNLVAAFCVLVCILLILSARVIYKYVKRNNAYKKQLKAAKDESEHKNREITDSIQYAKRIQTAILPDTRKVSKCLPNSFVFYQPKDIVAGDFYWMVQQNKKVLVAVADCTGHGVPGAMVSVVCHSALNRSVREFGLTKPAKILEKTRELVIETLEEGGADVNDGMDIALCSIDREGGMLQYAGANNSLYIIKNDSLHEVKADKQPVGKFDKFKPFTNHELKLNKGEQIFMFTDGFADQFGGPRGKKFKYKAFRNLLEKISADALNYQKVELESTFHNWKGDLEQIDDVCVVGVRL